MAAHILRVLKEFATHDYELSYVKTACSYAPAMDYLVGHDEYQYFAYAPDYATCKQIASELLPKYERLWEFLGKPETHEQWAQAVYDLKKHRKYKAYCTQFWPNGTDNWTFDYTYAHNPDYRLITIRKV